MFELAILLGLYSYILFFLGLFGVLYKNVVIIVTICFICISFLRFKESILLVIKEIKKIKLQEKFLLLLLLLFFLQIAINLIGVFAPELSFDALWYHLTLPKLYLLYNSIFYIPGGLLYYSAMPKLGELLFIGAMSIGNETMVKVLHLIFGLLISVGIYKLTRIQFSRVIAFIAVIIFYSNIIVAWESTIAYIDLIRTFYEFLALWTFTLWWKYNKRKWFFLSAVMLGFAVTTKVLAFGSLIIFCSLIFWKLFKDRKTYFEVLKNIILYIFITIIIPLPWFIFSFFHTGNPLYPFFTTTYGIHPEPISLIQIPSDMISLLLFAPDPISPIYLIFIPFIIIFFRKSQPEIKLLTLYSFLALIIWYFTPRTGGGRFILPYLPAFSILCAAVLAYLKSKKKYIFFYRFSLGIIIFISVITILYRAGASIKYIPVFMGQETKQKFLSENLNFAFSDFYDTDKYFTKHIKPTDKVLLFGFHNLYYVEFPYIDSSWVKKGDTFNFIAVQRGEIPAEFNNWQLIYTNAKTMVKLYKPPTDICKDLCVY